MSTIPANKTPLLDNGDRVIFRSTWPGYRHHDGKIVMIRYRLDTRLADGDLDRLYRVQTDDGILFLAFGSELTPPAIEAAPVSEVLARLLVVAKTGEAA